MNEEELTANPRLKHHFLQDLNKDQKLDLGHSSFDAVLICVSVQYLQYPEKVCAFFFRMLSPVSVSVCCLSHELSPQVLTDDL